MKRALALVFVAALAGCESAPPPSPPVALPTLTRPTLALQGDRRAANPEVPREAVIARGGIPGVFVLENGQARFRMVKTGTEHGTRTPILSGLTGNEVLVLGDLREVHDGSPIAAARVRP